MFAFKISGYLYLFFAIILGIASNGFLKTTNGFTNLVPTVFCIISIVLCIFCLSKVMILIPVGFAYATYGGLTITAVTIFGILKYNQLRHLVRCNTRYISLLQPKNTWFERSKFNFS